MFLMSACSSGVKTAPTENLPIVNKQNQHALKATLAPAHGMDLAQLKADTYDESIVTETAPSVVAKFSVKNHANKERIQWAVVTVPFEKGVVSNEQALYQYSLKEHGLVDWKALKWHFNNGSKHSVSIAALRFPVYLQPNQEVQFEVVKDRKSNPWPFAFGPNLHGMLSNMDPAVMVVAVAKLQGSNELYYVPHMQNPKVMHWGPHFKSIRSHGVFRKFNNPNETIGLNFTSYMNIHNRQDSGEFVFSVGSNTFEQPGPSFVEYVDLYYYDPFKVQVRGGEHYGVSGEQPTQYANYKKIRLIGSEEIGYGTEHTFRGLWSIPLNQPQIVTNTFDAQMQSPLIGVVDRADWQRTKAGGIVGEVVPLHGYTKAQIRNELQRFCAQDFDVRGSAPFHYANKTPGQTGDQPAFSSNMHYVQQVAIAGQSSCSIQHVLHGIGVETYRPTYHWFGKDRMKYTDTSNQCMWWSGKPHPAHNNSCPEWKQRSEGINGFTWGRSYAQGEDNQHWGNPILQSLYEMTGDVWAKDILDFRRSIALWDAYGDYSWGWSRIGSERGIRTGYNAVQLLQYNPDDAIADKLKYNLALHMRVRVQGDFANNFPWMQTGIDQLFQSSDIYGLETIVDDGRWPHCIGETPNATTHVTNKPYSSNRCVITWWTGFSMTFAYQMLKHGIETTYSQQFIDKYMDNKEFMFKPDGETYGSRRINDWSVNTGQLGGGSWISGWMNATKHYGKNHPNYSYFNEVFFPHMRQTRFQPSRTGFLNWEYKWYQ